MPATPIVPETGPVTLLPAVRANAGRGGTGGIGDDDAPKLVDTLRPGVVEAYDEEYESPLARVLLSGSFRVDLDFLTRSFKALIIFFRRPS